MRAREETLPETGLGRIDVVGVSKTFGDTRVVRDVDLDIRAGEFFSLLGPSGCGKTTILRMLAGFEYPDSGDIRIDGNSILGLAPNRRPVNLVFQRYELFPHMSVWKNVAYGPRLAGGDRAAIDAKVERMLDAVGILDLKDRRANELSGGQQQRVALARALINRPRALLLDEPLSALDVKLRKRMRVELKDIQETFGTTFVYVTHDQDEALMMSDRIAIMNGGQLLQVGTPTEIYEKPADPFVAQFVGELNVIRLASGWHRSEGVRLASSIIDPTSVDPSRSPSVFGVRPERMAASVEQPAGPIAVYGRILGQRYLGASTVFRVESELGELLVSANPRDLAFVAGDTVWVSWDADAVIDLSEH